MKGEERLIEPEELESRLGESGLAVIDLSHAHHHLSHRIPGSHHVDLQTNVDLQLTMARADITRDTLVVAYDDEGGVKAAGFLWRLALLGHVRWSLLNGGLHAWLAERLKVESGKPTVANGQFEGRVLHSELLLDQQAVMARLGCACVVLVDSRTLAEYRGLDIRSQFGGHIPGAVNIDWTLNIDPERKTRLRPRALLEAMFDRHGVRPENEVIVYCQNMNRAADTFVTLKTLGYERVKGYPGGWSEWGNSPETPKSI